jgi:hypothetical protein
MKYFGCDTKTKLSFAIETILNPLNHSRESIDRAWKVLDGLNLTLQEAMLYKE